MINRKCPNPLMFLQGDKDDTTPLRINNEMPLSTITAEDNAQEIKFKQQNQLRIFRSFERIENPFFWCF